MDIGTLLKGLVLGFSIAAPVGPIGVLCIRRTLLNGRAVGFASGLGAATADALYGAIAGFGLTVVAELLHNQALWLRLVGGVYLCYLGLNMYRSQLVMESGEPSFVALGPAYLSTFALTMTNPATILSFTAIFAGFLSSTNSSYATTGLLILGVFLGSALWWLALSSGVSLFRSKLTATHMHWINRIAGSIIISFGVLVLNSFRQML
jgi:threonine/homoserine/homoserine lactone efflux protein